MTKIETVIDSAVRWAIDVANNNDHGYSQSIRWGPSYDCSSFVISAYYQAGVPLQYNGPYTTRTMYSDFIRNGFRDVTAEVNRANCVGMKKGDVLLSPGHTCLYIGDNRVANCRSAEGTYDTRDNSGNEIRLQAYWNYPWSQILRLSSIVNSVPVVSQMVSSGFPPVLKYGDRSRAVEMAQQGLKSMGLPIGAQQPDGKFGLGTKSGVDSLKSENGLTPDGVIDEPVWKILLGV